MHSAVEIMLEKYNCTRVEEYRNALREIIQEIALSGLHRAGFFDRAAFYGGTALRIFYGLRRFSEDLDFSLLARILILISRITANMYRRNWGLLDLKRKSLKSKKTFLRILNPHLSRPAH